ncbi:NAD-dependent epimerase/dehydratase family protein [Trichocoleus desertorum]|uniref:SDR family oxidoreductase n=1 Tax=Trichocoleus desertorum GB2-A4 TaxID=2933944 RepID=A0ABV0J227_9CYAN|nr:SDR family oxidoreductase [Trichocoleus sp. FACHB-46]
MKVAIIGCGYVGMATARHWQQVGWTVTATTTSVPRLSELEAIADHAVLAQGNDETSLAEALTDQQVVLLSVGARSPNSYEETYLHTAKTLTKVLAQTPSVQQLIYTGSYAVYGDQQGNWVDETSPVKPANRNGEILAETEQVLLNAANSQLKVCVLRLGGIYGPGRELQRIFGRAAGTTRPGTGAEPSNWIHLDDIVGAIAFAQEHQLQGVYNLVQEVTLTSRELIEQVCQRYNLAPVNWDESQPSARSYNAKVSNQKLKTAGYQFIHPELQV